LLLVVIVMAIISSVLGVVLVRGVDSVCSIGVLSFIEKVFYLLVGLLILICWRLLYGCNFRVNIFYWQDFYRWVGLIFISYIMSIVYLYEEMWFASLEQGIGYGLVKGKLMGVGFLFSYDY